MRRFTILALCAALAAALPAAAIAQEAAPASGPVASPPPKKAKAVAKHAATRRKAAPVATQTSPAAPEAYQLVPTGQPTSAQARARRDAFGTPDAEPSPSDGGSRRIGIGLGGSNGTTPGMQMGF